MLTNKLQSLRNNILKKNQKSADDDQLLDILYHMDKLESILSMSDGLDESKSILASIIIKPAGTNCAACGRTVK